MAIYKMDDENRENLKFLIEEHTDTLLYSYLQGYMGVCYVDDIKNPTSAQILVADFCFFLGEVNEELAQNRAIIEGFALLIPENVKWERLIEEEYKSGINRITRYALKKDKVVFDTKYLEKVVKDFANKYELKLIDKNIYHKVMSEDWSRDLCSNFKTADEFVTKGLGVVAFDGKIIVGGASSYSIYDDGIEIEIDTNIKYRRNGIALATGAKLILECLKRGLYPSWDAYTTTSLTLSKKLGYELDYEYTAYEVWF